MKETKKLSAIQTRQVVAKFESHLKLEYTKFKKAGPGSADINLKEGLKLFKEYEKTLEKEKIKQSIYNNQQKLFDLQIKQFKELRDISEELAQLRKVYDLYQ